MGKTKTTKVLVIGLGQIGYSNAQYMTKKGMKVFGYDISKAAIKKALDTRIIKAEADSFAGFDAYVICVSTHNPADIFQPNLDALFEVANKIREQAPDGALACIESTIPAHITDALADAFGFKVHVVHCPHRFFAGDSEHGVRQTRVIAGHAACCMIKGRDFYNWQLGIQTHPVSTIAVAALSKLVENSHRFIEIAFAEELKMLCEQQNVDFEQLREAVNTKWNVKLMEARQGIGLHCLPKDSEMLQQIFNKAGQADSLIDTAKQIDVRYRQFIQRR